MHPQSCLPTSHLLFHPLWMEQLMRRKLSESHLCKKTAAAAHVLHLWPLVSRRLVCGTSQDILHYGSVKHHVKKARFSGKMPRNCRPLSLISKEVDEIPGIPLLPDPTLHCKLQNAVPLHSYPASSRLSLPCFLTNLFISPCCFLPSRCDISSLNSRPPPMLFWARRRH